MKSGTRTGGEAKGSRQLKALEAEITSAEKIVEALCFGKNRLHTLFEIDSAAIYTEEGCITIGNAPSAAWIESFVGKLLPLHQEVFSFSDSRAGLSCVPCEEATGALAMVLTREPATVILCFRTEFEHELTWGGDMMKAAVKTPGSERLSPRKSFAAYKQTIRGTSLPWTGQEVRQAREMLPILRRLLPPDHRAAASTIRQGIQELSEAVPSSSSLFRPLLDFVSEGMSLFINNHGGSTAPAFASQALLNQFNLDDHGPEFSLNIGDFFRHIGLPDDLLNRMHFGPQEVQVMTGRCANRSYLIQLKQILEITAAETRIFLAVLTFSNITKQARLLEATEAARKQADHASQIKSAFLANTTHEVRTPMNGILGVAHMLKSTALNPEQRELVEIIERSGKALLKVVNDVLDFSKIEAGKLTLESVAFNLRQLLQDVIRLFRPIVSQRVELLLNIENEVPDSLIGDPGRLRQIVVNLLGNAVKFTQEGQVRLQVQREKTSSVYVTLNFQVVDTGIGMPTHKSAKLFERFDQADASTSRKYGGTGLGLSISKELVTLMGGHIGATSTPGKGTTMFFKLTFLIDQPGPAEEEIRVEENSSLQSLASSCGDRNNLRRTEVQGPARVLLVDDNAINQKVALAMLTRDGYEVTVAGDGAQAVELSKQGGYDVILMDCQMPEMDGLEATARIRKGEAGRSRTPIIALTASTLKEQREQCLAAGMDDFMLKPINSQELLKMVRKWAVPSERPVTLESRHSL